MVSQTAPEQAIIERFKALGVCEELAEAAAALGWKSPTHIQEQAVPHLLQGGQQCHHVSRHASMVTHVCCHAWRSSGLRQQYWLHVFYARMLAH